MKFEFDSGKDSINQHKHGLSLAEAEALWAVPAVEADLGIVNGEYRYVRLAIYKGAVHLIIFTYRPGPNIRLISFRAATAKEATIYENSKKI